MTLWQWAAMGAGALIAAGVLLLVVYLLLARRRRTPLVKRRPTQAEADLRGDIRAMLGELESLAERIDARLNQRIEYMEQALRQADQRIAELEQLQGPPREVTEALASIERHRQVLRLDAEGYEGAEIARRLDMEPEEVDAILNLRRSGQTSR
jgi:C4-dicarboxylate-specific signal transduction histidine kinase